MVTVTKMELPVGTIFKYKTSFWKVSGPKRGSYGASSTKDTYPVVKCTKYGKEFQACNGFRDTMVEKLFLEGQTWMATYKEGAEVSTDNQARGIRRRRIQHVEASIAELQKELAMLMKEEFGDAGD